MNILLWILAIALACVFAVTGTSKLITGREQQIERTPYVVLFPHSLILVIGVLEILGAIGLILPAVLGVATVLVPLAAAGLAITMVFATLVHIQRGDPTRVLIVPIILAIPSVLLAWARFGAYPL